MIKTRVIPTFDCDRCKQCGLCSFVCPVDAIEAQDQSVPWLAKPEACTSCRACELICPDFAISMVEAEAEDEGAACDLGPPPVNDGPPAEGGA